MAPAGYCGAPTNPLGYNLCGRGSLVYQPGSSTCTYFTCASNFKSGTGYMVECVDGTYSMSGGHPDACAHDGGVSKPVSSGP